MPRFQRLKSKQAQHQRLKSKQAQHGVQQHGVQQHGVQTHVSTTFHHLTMVDEVDVRQHAPGRLNVVVGQPFSYFSYYYHKNTTKIW